MEAAKLFILGIKASGCVVCQEADPACLHFHHLDPKSKVKDISKLLRQGTIKRLKVEVEKCIVLCANCHLKLHAADGSGVNMKLAAKMALHSERNGLDKDQLGLFDAT